MTTGLKSYFNVTQNHRCLDILKEDQKVRHRRTDASTQMEGYFKIDNVSASGGHIQYFSLYVNYVSSPHPWSVLAYPCRIRASQVPTIRFWFQINLPFKKKKIHLSVFEANTTILGSRLPFPPHIIINVY